jgi:hypothetical protein
MIAHDARVHSSKRQPAFRGEDFKVNSVQEIPFGFRLIRAGEQIYPSGDCVSGYGWHGLEHFVIDQSWDRQLRDRWLSGTTRPVVPLSWQGRYGC